MKSRELFFMLAAVLSPQFIVGQKMMQLDAQNTTAFQCRAVFRGDSVHIVSDSQKTSILWLNGVDFKNGIIELDLKGIDVRGESFLGVAFHGRNDSTYCAIYFRPFNFRSPDRSKYALQFVDLPGNDWDMLRDKSPNMYENSVNPVPDPNGWFHVRIIVCFPSIKVFVNEAAEPSLTVRQITGMKAGKVGLWIDSKEGWFRRLTIQHSISRQ
jgi:hypothetical protein